ncbi:MAG TPA: DUF6263 family protein [Verrucomicrobiota bacterium]|nr:DUF6263 family protein [Verrucomicrobiota bacterium]
MKKTTVISSLCVATIFALLVGCSKREESNASSGAGDTVAGRVSKSDDPAELKVKWPIGTTYSMRMELDQTSETKVPNQPEPIQQAVKMTQDFDMSAVKELANGGRQLELQFKGLTMTVSQEGQQVMNFDSARSESGDAGNPIVPLLRKMVGARLLYVIDASGKVEKVEGVSELMTRIGFNRKSQTHAMFGQMFSEETLKQYGAFGEAMPNRIVKVGESWSDEREMDSGIGRMNVDMKSTFKNWNQYGDYKCALIRVEGKMSSASGAPSPGTTITMEKGTTSGDIWFDPVLGMIVNQIVNQDMTLKMMAGSQSISPQIKQRIRVALERVSKAR